LHFGEQGDDGLLHSDEWLGRYRLFAGHPQQ
jgi:hypothetical protein